MVYSGSICLIFCQWTPWLWKHKFWYQKQHFIYTSYQFMTEWKFISPKWRPSWIYQNEHQDGGQKCGRPSGLIDNILMYLHGDFQSLVTIWTIVSPSHPAIMAKWTRSWRLWCSISNQMSVRTKWKKLVYFTFYQNVTKVHSFYTQFCHKRKRTQKIGD